MKCERRLALLRDYRDRLGIYTEATLTLKDALDGDAFDAALTEAEAARLDFMEARRALREHEADHGCG